MVVLLPLFLQGGGMLAIKESDDYDVDDDDGELWLRRTVRSLLL